MKEKRKAEDGNMREKRMAMKSCQERGKMFMEIIGYRQVDDEEDKNTR